MIRERLYYIPSNGVDRSLTVVVRAARVNLHDGLLAERDGVILLAVRGLVR